ncbi:glutathione peroxidase [Rhodopirellula sp. MGV]|uniref:glutathione peroxidase n=1 Tax=Rhodopirellula sp. MGV TaxID=2023130 RepID=UPI002101C33A|nr:glutathione peroxidase [Rhodopirellula sp. MGV]
MPNAGQAAEKSTEHECALDFKMKDIDGKEVDLEDYEGKVVLIVNTASQCGLTPQYTGLESLYQKYKDKGFVILGFPCNQFGSQEPGTDAEIKTFCSTQHNVSFPMFSKIKVNSDEACDLYKYLTSKDTKPKGAGAVSWNFEKFLIDREGNLVGRFEPRTTPSDSTLVKAIEAKL